MSRKARGAGAAARRARGRAAGGPAAEDGSDKSFDAEYFARWYHDPAHRVKSSAYTARQVDFVLHAAEWVLERPVRSVLDVGCGEGVWGRYLRRRRPSLTYTGVDPSEYVVARYGARRHIRLGDATALDAVLPAGATYDLVLAVGVLNYLPPAQLERAFVQIAARVRGVAYLELFAAGDAYEGDVTWPTPRRADWYRRRIERAGLRHIGLQLYAGAAACDGLSRLERT